MTGNSSFVRKIIYFVLIAALLVPLYLISHPSTRSSDGTFDEGGTLARMRIENNLSQANLGEIDPAGASMSLATLGMRGVAANLLWGQAIKYKKTENWDGFKAALNQITKLQPNFETVWVYQAWNLAYNISAEFDDYHHRYHWIKKGIHYLVDGTRFNRSMPSLLHEVGWFFQHKIGRADERRQYRELFREDKDFHAQLDAPDLPIDMELTNGPGKKPDSFLVAHEWYRAGERLVETHDAPIRRKNPLLFYSNAAMALMYYNTAIQDEGHINAFSQAAWKRAHEEWKKFGDRGIPTRYGFDIRLNDLDRLIETEKSLRQELNNLVPGAEQQLRAERMEGLPKEMRDALNVPASERNRQQYELAKEAQHRTEVSMADIAIKASPDSIAMARACAMQASNAKLAIRSIRREREVINFTYWMTRSQSEQTDLAISARKHLYAADQFYKDTDLENARSEYELSFEQWAEVYKAFPILIDDVEAEENYDAVQRYRKLLERMDESFPPPGFPLHMLLEYYDGTFADPDFDPTGDVTEGTAQAEDGDAQETQDQNGDEANSNKASSNEQNEDGRDGHEPPVTDPASEVNTANDAEVAESSPTDSNGVESDSSRPEQDGSSTPDVEPDVEPAQTRADRTNGWAIRRPRMPPALKTSKDRCSVNVSLIPSF